MDSLPRFENSERVVVFRRPANKRRRATFIRCGSNGALVRALAQKERTFDLIASFYAVPSDYSTIIGASDWACTGGLSKFHAAKLFDAQYSLVEAYEHVLFLDPDIEITSADVEKLFRIAERHGLDLCQASLTVDSYSAFGFLHHTTYPAEYCLTNFVEVMAPCFSRKALAKCIGNFDKSISTWGLDMQWPFLLRFKGIAVVDGVQMRHAGRPDLFGGPFYQYLNSMGIDPRREMTTLRKGVVARHIYVPGRLNGPSGWLSPLFSKIWHMAKRRVLRHRSPAK